MIKQFIETGKIVGTHGIKGMVRVQPWSDSGEFLTDFRRFYTDDKGAYLLNREVFSAPQDVTIVFEDVDGEEHGGEYAPAKATPEVKGTKEGDKKWYGGAFEVEADARLMKK